MATRPLPAPYVHRLERPTRRSRGPILLGVGVVVLLALAGAAAAVVVWSGANLASDPVALARVNVETFGGKLVQARAFGADGRAIPLTVRDGRLVPRALVTPGERIAVAVAVRRPGWLGWALGHVRHERLTIRAPVARVVDRWLTVPAGSRVRVRFSQPVARVAFGHGGRQTVHRTGGAARFLTLPSAGAVGSAVVAAAPRSWERIGRRATVNWFPSARAPVVVGAPRPGAPFSPVTPIRLTFAQPVAQVLHGERPNVTPHVPGHWRKVDGHSLTFVPTGLGADFNTQVHVSLPRPVAMVKNASGAVDVTRRLTWTVPPASMLRLQQLLADAGYLPVVWRPARKPVARTLRAQLRAAVAPGRGQFEWRYPNTPPELQALWAPGQPNTIVRGAVMTFQDEHGLTVDGIAGPVVWRTLIRDAIAGKRRDEGYSYVYVHENVPQSLTLWHNGSTILTSPGNTGIPAAPTQLGTFPVFEHIAVGTMSGTNPDGSHYNDPGIRYISYFNGGDAIHAFNRASFGTPQSLGCVELPLDAAARVWPYTPIGTLVTVES